MPSDSPRAHTDQSAAQRTTAEGEDRADVADGIVFPRAAGDRRSTSAAGRRVFAAAARVGDPALARAIESARRWHRAYGPFLVAREALWTRRCTAGCGAWGINPLP